MIIIFKSMFLIGFIIFGFISIYIASNAIENEATRALTNMASEASEIVEARIETQVRTLEMIDVREEIESINFQQ